MHFGHVSLFFYWHGTARLWRAKTRCHSTAALASLSGTSTNAVVGGRRYCGWCAEGGCDGTCPGGGCGGGLQESAPGFKWPLTEVFTLLGNKGAVSLPLNRMTSDCPWAWSVPCPFCLEFSELPQQHLEVHLVNQKHIYVCSQVDRPIRGEGQLRL